MIALLQTPIASSGSFLITPNVGLMVWTIVVFLISLFILRKWVFPLIGETLDKRAKSIDGDIDAATSLREEADKVLDEYRERLKEARTQSEEIIQRARQTAESTSTRRASAARSCSRRRPSAPSATSTPPPSARLTTSAGRSPS